MILTMSGATDSEISQASVSCMIGLGVSEAEATRGSITMPCEPKSIVGCGPCTSYLYKWMEALARDTGCDFARVVETFDIELVKAALDG